MLAFLSRHYLRFLVLLGLGVFAGCCLAWLICSTLSASLPPLDGTFHVEGISEEATISRDGRGIPTISGTTRADVAFALGFAHAQDRLFQMDLMRRHAAGELSELIGKPTVAEDMCMRLHRFRWRARRALEASPAAEREIITAYTRGVAAGRATIRKLPWEYLLLGVDFVPWREEDCLLVGLEMYEQLQHGPPERERALGIMNDLLPPALVRFLTPSGCCWDEALDGSCFPGAPVPGEKEVDLRTWPHRRQPRRVVRAEAEPPRIGSNNWAVSRHRTRDGRAIIACDMHLGLRVPGTWYRACLQLNGRRITGVTLPGTPAVVVGSNGDIAWGFTNVEADTSDLVLLDDVPDRPDHYQTPDGPRAIEFVEEAIKVKGAPPVGLVIEETIWGPVVRDHRKRRMAHRWVAHDPGAVNLGLMRLERARSVMEALLLAPTFGVPAQNFVVADRRGRIGWTILGRLPNRFGHDGRTPSSWADGTRGWKGFLPGDQYPRVYDPPEGLLWTANNRTIGEPWASRVGYWSADHGARARQIHKGLSDRESIDEGDMLEVQLDDRGLFLRRWRALLLRTIDRHPDASEDSLVALRREVVGWQGRAAASSVGFRVVSRFRILVRESVLGELCAPCYGADRRFNVYALPACVEDSVWRLANDCPAHLRLPGATTSHPAQALEWLRAEVEGKLGTYTQGELNRGQRGAVRHPLSPAIGPLAAWMRLDMPDDRLPGDRTSMPRIQGGIHGASERMGVSPGHEEDAYFHMPAGQSGHFLSPHYADGHDDWVYGRASQFLPGEESHRIRLVPAG
jgi:penicillin amidase